ncbi:MAG: AAA-like domain-containing protein [bacterium]
MKRFFNTAGPVRCEQHYCLPPLERIDHGEIMSLIAQGKYFVLHAPRQTGKTTCLLALLEHLNATGKYRALYFNVEPAQAAREDVPQAMRAILEEMAMGAKIYLQDDFIESQIVNILQKGGEFTALDKILTLWAQESPLPLILLIDEIDSLVGDTLISVLRQIRSGYTKRPTSFPQSIILCGVRDVRDYRLHTDPNKAIITGGSAFNIKAKSLRLGDFSREEISILYQQHTEETGQIFVKGVLDIIYDLSTGQPWLVNALGYEVCFEMKEGRERNRPITIEMVEEAKEEIIRRRETHLDQLVDKLSEERVRRVIEPILTGTGQVEDFHPDDVQYTADLGLIKVARNGAITLANRIYQEIIPRELAWNIQTRIIQQPAWYILPNGLLDMIKLLSAFQEFFREHSEHWVERFDYKEAGPQLLIQAFLQRIVNGGGDIEREYGLGRMRTDILVVWPYKEGVQKIVIELKIVHKSVNGTINEGVRQTLEYMDRCKGEEGHLVIFDKSKGKSWEEKVFKREEVCEGKRVVVWGM